ncbi:DNA-binding protein K10-like [Topomyia yanbarensis]|uniref:DNA-binding protein K10-like n=1 Tax=Topomyia yanbarensis TaxID=2498891 RepID=UPI00273B3026|nr:DNA-binding protein K10-like [Topomyia yanbarensis]
MVATKPIQKRRGGFSGMPGRPRFKPKNSRNLFNANQLGDNPGFVDFNDDIQIPAAPATSTVETSTNSAPATNSNTAVATTAGSQEAKGFNNRKGNLNLKRPNARNGYQSRRMFPAMNAPWGPPIPPMPPMYPMGGGRRNGPFPPIPPPHFRVPPMGMRGMRGGPIMPPPPPNGRFNMHPMGPGPMAMMPRPMPPIPPMRGPMMNPMGRGIPPALRNRPDGPQPMRRTPNGKLPPGGRPGKPGRGAIRPSTIANGKGTKPINRKPRVKGTGKPREEYPLDKPWVTQEIRDEHEKKVELAERLKGHKDDALFGQFKEQRDKFVTMYDAARLEFIGKHPEQDVDKILAGKNAKIESKNSKDAVSTDSPAATTASTTAGAAAADATTTTTTTTATASDAGKSAASSA